MEGPGRGRSRRDGHRARPGSEALGEALEPARVGGEIEEREATPDLARVQHRLAEERADVSFNGPFLGVNSYC